VSWQVPASLLALLLHWSGYFIATQSFPLLSLFLGDLCVLPLALMLLVAFAWALRYMPETVGKTLVQIQDELAGR